MKVITAFISCFLLILNCQPIPNEVHDSKTVITTDIHNFWEAYDKIITTADRNEQMQYLKKLFLQKGTSGLNDIMKARKYTPEEYLEAILKYPNFWASMRKNLAKAEQFSNEIELGIEELRKLYPNLKPAKIYFTMGVFRTGGTTMEDKILIGSETAMVDKNVDLSDFPHDFYLRTYWASNPIDFLVLTNVHEYIHTQQKDGRNENLLFRSLKEGVAEFISVLAMNTESTTPSVKYGKQNEQSVRAAFQKEMFSNDYGYWLYSNRENPFGVRDLGYYIGYEMVERYYQKATDKKKVIAELIELDYNDQQMIENIIDESGYFEQSIAELSKTYKLNRPRVVNILPFKNGEQKVDPTTQQVTIEFSRAMDIQFRGFEFGPLGEPHVLRVQNFLGFSEDQKSISFEVTMEANKSYQLVLSPNFRAKDGTRIEPYLIDIKTSH